MDIRSFFKIIPEIPICNSKTINYNNQVINPDSINVFTLSNRRNNDKNNKIRESIIGAIINNKIPLDFYKQLPEWDLIKNGINNYIITLNNNNPITTIKCTHKGGRNCHYDFELLINETNKFNIEFKFNAEHITESPQWFSPGKPSQYLSNSYEDFYYDNYLKPISIEYNMSLPNKDEYLNTIHSPNPSCVIDYQTKYYNGCKSSSKYSGNENDVKFYEDCKLTSKKSISNFIENTVLDIAKLNKRLQNTQKDKVYMLYKNNKFYHETMNNDDYEIVSYIKKPDKSKYIAKAKNGKNMNILLRWKNGNGIAFPAFQIS